MWSWTATVQQNTFGVSAVCTQLMQLNSWVFRRLSSTEIHLVYFIRTVFTNLFSRKKKPGRAIRSVTSAQKRWHSQALVTLQCQWGHCGSVMKVYHKYLTCWQMWTWTLWIIMSRMWCNDIALVCPRTTISVQFPFYSERWLSGDFEPGLWSLTGIWFMF